MTLDEINPIAQAVYKALWDATKEKNPNIAASVIGRKIGRSDSAVIRAYRQLAEAKLIRVKAEMNSRSIWLNGKKMTTLSSGQALTALKAKQRAEDDLIPWPKKTGNDKDFQRMLELQGVSFENYRVSRQRTIVAVGQPVPLRDLLPEGKRA